MDYKSLENSIVKNDMKFFDKGEYNLNFAWIRNDLKADNHFADDLYIGYRENNVGKVLNVKCTTIPGTKKSLFNPIVVDGIKGTAVIKKGQYRGCWQFLDKLNL